jgi:murein DD-endopeptidase MepM/ murein hydrolase activator NlpD
MTGTARRRYVSVMVHHDGAPESHSYHLPVWAFRTLMGLAALTTLGVLVGLAMVAPLARAALRVPVLEEEVRRLQADNSKISQLAAALDSVEHSYARVRRMVGADVVPDPIAASTDLPIAPPVLARSAARARFPTGPTSPRYWPLDEAGFITRGIVGDSTPDESHPGIDIAVPIGTIVRAGGGGTVQQTGTDPEYGEFVRLGHPSGYESMYGHLSRIIVTQGETVEPGEVIGLSGNTGRSTAPHLHFEVRHGGRSIDPLILVKEGR